MRRLFPEILAHLLQALLYGALARELGMRWVGYAAVLGVASFLQALGAFSVWRDWRRMVQLAGGLSVLLILGLYGELFAQVWMLNQAFGPQTAEAALQPLWIAAAMAPWLLFWPLSRSFPQRLLLLVGLLPVLHGASPALPPPNDAEAVATALWQQSQGGATATVPPQTLVTPFQKGERGKSLPSADGRVTFYGTSGDALLVEIPLGPTPGGLLRPGSDAPPWTSPSLFARSYKRKEVIPGVSAPAAVGTLRYQSVLVSNAGVVRLEDSWSPPPEVTAENLRASVAAGARHLLANMQSDGRFTYIVRGPSGRAGTGYNYPRHAGTSWFLARAAAALKNPEIGAAADASLGHLERQSGRTDDGRAYVLDPERSDGKAWVGTTALALMALSLRQNQPELADGWLRQVAASVDENGKVRGEMTLKTGIFPDQPANPYGQGQVMLALLLAERAGWNQGKSALDRAEQFVARGYVGAHPLVVADEHWMCLVASALHSVRQSDAADRICAAYLSAERFSTPSPGGANQPQAGPAGGLAEAVVAWARITGDPAWKERSHRYAWLFLRSQYREADAPMLGLSHRLIGGFRDTPGQLDVQIDAVQHIGSALLGIAVLEGGEETAGSWP